MKKSFPVSLALALLLASCASPRQRELVTPLTGEALLQPTETAPLQPEPQPLPPATTNIVQPAEIPAPTAAYQAVPVPSQSQIQLMQHWISWDRWAEANGLGRPVRVPDAPAPTFALRPPGHEFTLTMGSQTLRWNGVNLDLGFAPRLTNNQLFVHALDAAKTLDPFVAAPAHLPPRGRRIIVLDPGHGGENTGTPCVCNNRFEKHYTLDWANRLQPLLEAQGWRVFLTRTNDVDISLTNRVAFADQVQADFFLSLHFNGIKPSSKNGQTGGVETYCMTPAGLPSTLTREFEDEINRVYPNNAFDAQNLLFAARLHRTILQATGQRDRSVRRARFMTVLQGQNRPAVLIEGGYLSDPREARIIATASFRQKLAEAVAAALAD